MNKTVITTKGERFTQKDHEDLAIMIYRRFGNDIYPACAAWRRMLENDCPLKDFERLILRLKDYKG